MEEHSKLRQEIMVSLQEKANLQQKVFDNTLQTLTKFKDVLHEMSSELNDDLEDQLDKRVKIEYRDRGKFEAQIQLGENVLLFLMHTNIFSFNRESPIWQNEYVKNDRNNSYCGIINIYNFLTDSIKYGRATDEGYLVGRIFVNHEMQYFVEGKRQYIKRHNRFGTGTIDKTTLVNIIETAIRYSLEFDLLAPTYEHEKIMLVEQLSTKMEHTKLKTGKRLGYAFKTDDV